MEYDSISKYDRIYGSLRDLCANSDIAATSKPSTVQYVEHVSGRAETYIVETIRDEKGDHLFVQCVDDKQQVTRLALPPRVSKAIQSQARKLDRRSAQQSKERRAELGRKLAAERMARGELPAFLVKKNQA